MSFQLIVQLILELLFQVKKIQQDKANNSHDRYFEIILHEYNNFRLDNSAIT